MQPAIAYQQKGRSQQRCQHGNPGSAPGLLVHETGLALGQLAQRLGNFPHKAVFQILAHRQLQTTEKLRRAAEQR